MEICGRRLAVALTLGEPTEDNDVESESPISEEALISMFKETFDAQEVEDNR